MSEPKTIVPKSYRAVDIHMPFSVVKKFGIWRAFWGADIFINDVPVVKLMVLANVITWLIMSMV